jgi:hypothetical protein
MSKMHAGIHERKNNTYEHFVLRETTHTPLCLKLSKEAQEVKLWCHPPRNLN